METETPRIKRSLGFRTDVVDMTRLAPGFFLWVIHSENRFLELMPINFFDGWQMWVKIIQVQYCPLEDALYRHVSLRGGYHASQKLS